MLVIRLRRVNKKNQPAFKIIVKKKKKAPTKGIFIEEVGFWNPLTKERILKGERIKYWLSVGAKTSGTVHNMLIDEKVIEGEKIKKHSKTKKEKRERSEEKEKESEKEKEPDKEEKEQEKKEKDQDEEEKQEEGQEVKKDKGEKEPKKIEGQKNE